jgi:hypothetical protein
MYPLQLNGAEHNAAYCKRNLPIESVDSLTEVWSSRNTWLKSQIVEAIFFYLNDRGKSGCLWISDFSHQIHLFFNMQTFLYITGEIIIIVSYFLEVWNKLLVVFYLKKFQIFKETDSFYSSVWSHFTRLPSYCYHFCCVSSYNIQKLFTSPYILIFPPGIFKFYFYETWIREENLCQINGNQIGLSLE